MEKNICGQMDKKNAGKKKRKKNAAHICDRVLLSMRRKEALTFVTMWMKLEDIMLSKISQTQKHRYSLISLIWNLQKKKKKGKSKKGD